MRRVVVRKLHGGYWAAGIEGHPMAVSTHETWDEAVSMVPGYVAIAQIERRAADALTAAFDRESLPAATEEDA